MSTIIDRFNNVTLQSVKASYEFIVYQSRNRILAYVFCKTGLSMNKMQNVNAMSEEDQEVFMRALEGINGEQIREWWKTGGEQEFETKRAEQQCLEYQAKGAVVFRICGGGVNKFFAGWDSEGDAMTCVKPEDAKQFEIGDTETTDICKYTLEQFFADCGATIKVINTKRKEV